MDRNGASLDAAIAALAALPGEPPWSEAQSAVIPLLERVRPLPLLEEPVSVYLEPGVRVGFGVDLGPLFLHVSAPMLRRWGVDVGQLARRAIATLRLRAHGLPAEAAVATRFGLTPVAVLQAPDGWASSLVLVPDMLPRWFGEGARIFIVPARNMLVALPPRTDLRLARWLREALAEELPDALAAPAFAWDGSRLRCASPMAPRRPSPSCWRPPAQGARTSWYTPPDRSVR